MGQTISNIFGGGEGGRDESPYRRVAVEDIWESGGKQTIPNRFQPNPYWDTRLSASSLTVVHSSRRVAIVQECDQIGGTQQNVPKSLHLDLNSSSNTRLSTCPTKVVDSSRRRIIEGSGGTGGTQQNIPKNLRSELELSSKTRPSTCSSKIEDSSRIRVVAESYGSGGTQQNISKSLQFELESLSNKRLSTCSSKVEYSSRMRVVEESGGTQQNISKTKSLQPVLESSSNKRLSTCLSKVKDSSGRVVEDSGQSGGIQQNVPKSSRRKSPNEKERMHSSSNDTRQSSSSSTKVATTSIWVVKESDGCGGTQQNVLKSSKEKPCGKKEILPSSSNAIGLSTPSTKLPVSCRKVIEESSENGGTHQNVAKSSKKKDKKEILHSSSNDTRQSSSSSTKVIVSSIVKENGESGGTKQNVQKSSLPSTHWREKTLNSSANAILSTPSTKVIDSSKWVVEESSQNGGSQQNVTKSSRRKCRSKKAILHSSNTSTKDWVISIPRIEEMIEKLVAESSQTTVKEDKQIKHYRGSHKILLVGEGDFSFSTCLAKAFGSAANMVATSLDSTEFLELNYGKAISNINELKKRWCMVMHGFDVHNMANWVSVKGMKFDRIIYNFPLAGFFYDKSKAYRLRQNKMLMKSFFENARMMLSENGEVHVSHKCNNGFFREWDLEALALNHGLQLIAELEFKLHDYPGYNTKYGFGGDENFECTPSMTYKFVMKHQASQS